MGREYTRIRYIIAILLIALIIIIGLRIGDPSHDLFNWGIAPFGASVAARLFVTKKVAWRIILSLIIFIISMLLINSIMLFGDTVIGLTLFAVYGIAIGVASVIVFNLTIYFLFDMLFIAERHTK